MSPSLYNMSQKLKSVPLISREAISVPQFYFQEPYTPLLILNSVVSTDVLHSVSGMAIAVIRAIIHIFLTLDTKNGLKKTIMDVYGAACLFF